MEAKKFFDKYKYAAIYADVKSGIPASVTLAQAAIESGYGKSKLAVNANNYFGIKAYSNPRGLPVYYADDDLKAEPFRKYPTVAASFADHTKFLKENSRYKDLFKTHSYIEWAHGLKKAGYATAPNYATLIISTIEKNNLQRYDVWGANRKLLITAAAISIFLLIAIVLYLILKPKKNK